MSLGEKAVEYALEGNSGFMPLLVRTSDEPYAYSYEIGMLSDIANKEKQVPTEWITESQNDVKPELVSYMKPLILGEVSIEYKNGLPSYMEIPHLTGK
jgi:6-phosphofructokinase 1